MVNVNVLWDMFEMKIWTQTNITWKKFAINKKYILRIMGLKFQNPKFNILWNSILEQAKMAAQDYMLQYFKILKL